MIDSSNQSDINFSWQTLWWRLLLTGLLLLVLAGSGLSLFSDVTASSPDTVLPAIEFQSIP